MYIAPGQGQTTPEGQLFSFTVLFSHYRRFLKVFTIYGHGGHLGHVTCTIYINFLSHFPRRIHMKFGIGLPVGFREEDV